MLGCLPLIDPAADRLLMLDIGGGSTEIMWLDRREPPNGQAPGYSLSMPLGVVTLSETFGGGSDERAYAAMVSHSVERLAEANRLPASAHGHNGPGLQMLGTSGTVTTLAAVHLGLRRYVRRKADGISLPFSVIHSVSRMLCELDDTARAAHPCIGHDRADLVVAGCAILEAVHRCWPVEHLQVADRGLREGILNALLGHTIGQALLRTEACA
jgi:exopolyphosphatase/guanosine-5'-triphosphate,3'-diphosphate pyrophosphatase